MVGEVKLSITRSWVQNLSLPDERSNRETSRRIGFHSVYLVSLRGLPFTLLHFISSLMNCSVFLVIRWVHHSIGLSEYSLHHKIKT